jgi:hypothetical protein
MAADVMGVRHVRRINGINRAILPAREGTSGNIDEVWSLSCNPVKTLYHVLGCNRTSQTRRKWNLQWKTLDGWPACRHMCST